MDGRIALFTRDLAVGGVARVIVNLTRGLIDRGHPVDVVLSRARGPLLDQLAGEVRVVDLGVERTLTSVPGLVRYLRREQPTALLSCQDGANVVALWSKRFAGGPTRTLISTHTHLSLNADRATAIRARVIPTFARRFYHWADEVIAVSGGVADDLAETARVPRRRIRVIHNPVDVHGIRRLAREPLSHPWFNADARPVVLSAGRLTLEKDYPTLIRAFDRLRRRRPARLVIVGEGAERPRLEALAHELGCAADVDLPGFVANPYPYMAAARVFALSSMWEGFGNVLIEAMALGTPVISTDCPSGPAEILDQGRYGTLVPVGDVDALADTIGTQLNRPQDNNGAISRANSFSTGEITARYLAAIHGQGDAC